MGIGIALLVVGAILSFAVRDSVPGVDLTMIGYICMGAGALALILSLVANAQATNTKRTNVVEHVEHRDDTTR
ncbi:MAG TPA: DUF6458 family protein [Propionicimonas sp.]|uniref:DUF6458 family protein n=1 Tax=Propionicimonas sp. TaxID=1955623 RepID=UPI002F3EEF3C